MTEVLHSWPLAIVLVSAMVIGAIVYLGDRPPN